ncbi:MAG: ABC transporter permease, partial [Acidobacteriota bacterium]|nr:ABC transporter permease [Acidobacteriota bacterium]
MIASLLAFRQALRRLARAPVFAGLVILTLAPGIGAHLAIFSLVDLLLLRPLPFVDAGRLAGVYETRRGEGYFPLSLPNYIDYRSSSRVWSALASHYPTAPLSLTSRGESVEINGSVVSANYFQVLGIVPALGRFFLPEEDAPAGASPVTVLSHKLWLARFSGRKEIVGQVVTLNGSPFTVVGVTPAGFEGVLLGIPSDVWLPNGMAATGYRWCDPRSRDCTWLSMIGRLGPGRTLRQAQAEMALLSGGLRQAYPAANAARGLRVTPLRGIHPQSRPDTLRLAALLLGAVTLGVAATCANLSSLLLARTLTRRKEIAVRLALGATRLGIVSQFVAEALLLALLGAAAGALMAVWFGRVIVALYPSDVPLELTAGPAVLGYASLLSVLIGMAVGLVPGLQATRPNLVTALKEEVVAGG